MSDSVQEDATRYADSSLQEQMEGQKGAAMTREQRWAFYASDAFTAQLTSRFHRAKVKALTSGAGFYGAR